MSHNSRAEIHSDSPNHPKAVCLKGTGDTYFLTPSWQWLNTCAQVIWPPHVFVWEAEIHSHMSWCSEHCWQEPYSRVSYQLPTPCLRLSAGKLPHLPSHPSGNCCLVSGRGSNQAILIKILLTNLNTIKNRWWQFLSVGKNCVTQNPRTIVSCIPPWEKVYLQRVETKQAGVRS